MITYKEYYEICKKSYKNDLKTDKNLYEFTYDMPDISYFGDKYLSLVTDISSFLDEQYQNKDNIYNVPGQNPDKQPLCRYKKPWEIPNIEKLANILIPYVEKTIFNCNLYAMAAYAYKTKPGIYDSKSVGSLLWHIDNHPKEVVKIMVYLNDVDNTTGPFEILDKQGSGYKFPTTRVSCNEWSPSHNNIVHRATFCDERERSVITFMVKPIDRKVRPYISEKHTGTNYHKDVFKNPCHFGVVEK